MKSVTVTITFRGCFDGCPYAEGADRTMCPVYCTRVDRRVMGYSQSSCEIPAGADYPPWCTVPDVAELRTEQDG